MPKDLRVSLLGETVGSLRQEASGRLTFTYDPAWLGKPKSRPISLSLPLQQETFDDRSVRPFFAGLLPDEDARERLARYLGISRHNDFALLAEVGGECAGAVALHPPGSELRPDAGELGPLDAGTLGEFLRDLPRRPLLVGGELRLSLAGAQDKMALIYRGGEFYLPSGDQPTTHILKPAIKHFSETVANEFFCLRLADHFGLGVPKVEMGSVDDVPFLLVERYDRALGPGDQIQRLHQEDFCQALAIPPEQKYQGEGGPSLEQCFGLLDVCSRPVLDRLELLKRVIFNYLIGNADAHGKNFALLHLDTGSELAPAYDLLCTTVYPDHTDQMAMKMGGKRRFSEVFPRHWERFAQDVGFAPPRVKKDLMTMARRLPIEARQLAEELRPSLQESALAMVNRMCDQFGHHAEHVQRWAAAP